SRAHRMGQRKPVQVYLLVTEETIEESLLNTLSAKHELALAALDVNSEVKDLSFGGSMEELKRRLEVLLGEKPEAPVDESQREKMERQLFLKQRRQSISRAGGQLLSAAFSFMGELLVQEEGKEKAHAKAESKYMEILSECLEKNEDGSLQMTIKFPDDSAIKALARTLSAITGAAGQQ
ncbi:unnamed protein product, partial [marine sediment metagenome]